MMTTPEIASEITVMPIPIIGVDAAILYSDILMIPDALGMGLSFITGEGPRFEFCLQDCASLNKLDPDGLNKKLSYVFKTIKLSLKKLPKDFPLLGFAGAPFTVACYMICGSNKLNISTVKNFAWTQPKVFEQLLNVLTEATINYLLKQYQSGVSAIQLFDTWAGHLSVKDYRELAKPYTQKVFNALQKAYVPSIHYILNGNHLIKDMGEISSDAIGVDWRADLNEIRQMTKTGHAIQGNLDPDLLLSTPAIIESRLKDMISSVPNPCKGYIINLGHGITPKVPVKNAKVFVEKAKALFR